MARYFSTMHAMQEAISAQNYARGAALAKENVSLIPSFVQSTMREHKRFDIRSIPGLEAGGTMLALAGDHSGIEEMKRVTQSLPQLSPWTSAIDEHLHDMALFEAIEGAIRENPGCLQPSVKKLVGVTDGRRVATLIAWLEKADRVTRRKKGSTYELFLPGMSDVPMPRPKRSVNSHRADRGTVGCREIDLSRLPVLSLPRAPLRWEEHGKHGVEAVPVPDDQFAVVDAPGWVVEAVEKIPMADRPDTAYRKIHPTDDGIILFDDLGNGAQFPQASASAIRFDRSGAKSAEAALLHDVYRLGVNALGRGLIGMSKDCVVHAYDADLRLIMETAMATAPEVRALKTRFGIQDGALKNHLRTVALAHDATRYMVTGVDEAWCINIEGEAMWGLKFPLKEGWGRAMVDDGQVGTSREIQEALDLMGLGFPVAPDDIKHRYRELAKHWHPDRNPGDSTSNARMTALIEAVSVLRGVDPGDLDRSRRDTFVKDVHQKEIEIAGGTATLSIGMGGGEAQAADWIYAASFAGRSHGVFLAGYSGRIVQVDAKGAPIRAYDIGSVPRRIVDTGDYLYFLTDTRLYVLQADRLHAIVDTCDAGNLIMAQAGFGLLERKRFRWFCEDGRYIGTVVATDPIRRVYWSSDGLVIETRQRRAVVSGAPIWWE